jgi:methyl-accepting chemotaxis protein
LAVKSAGASKDVRATIAQSEERIRAGVNLAGEMRSVLETIVGSVDSVSGQLEQIGIASSNQLSRVSDVTQSVEKLGLATLGYSSLVERTTNSIQVIDRQISALANQVASITTSVDWPHVTRAIDGSLAVSKAFETAINRGLISFEDCFDESYSLIKGSNPEQYMTKFVELADSILPPIQEPLLKSSSSVFFCVAIDRNGFVPTNNLKYCQPQGPDPVWNAVNCRNRRLAHDPVRMAAAKNKKPYLLQCYRRDMGGGNILLLKSAAAPITIRGRHWGCLSIGYTVSDNENG